jgi:septal ring factor EnvC (AmiA/AmiB activator)
MADEPENLTLRCLRRIDERTAGIEETQTDHGERLTTIEWMLAGLRREQAVDAEARASLEGRIDRLTTEINRIKRRLDLDDAPAPA